MASHESALKKHRQDLRRREQNRQHRSRYRTAVKKLRVAIETGDVEAARSLLPKTLSLIGRTAHLGIIHRNTAARTKSRVTRALQKLSAKA